MPDRNETHALCKNNVGRSHPRFCHLGFLARGSSRGPVGATADRAATAPENQTPLPAPPGEISRDYGVPAVQTEQWMMHLVAGERKEVPKLRWIFTGSLVREGVFAAQSDGSIAALYHDQVAMIDNASPAGASDKIWHVREGAVPPAGRR